jgi:putative transposase
MVLYRRNRIAGGTYFFTVTLRDFKSALLVEHIGLLRAAVLRTRLEKPFTIDVWVVLPEHMHAVWTLPPGDSNYSARWRSIKGYFSHEIAKLLEHPRRNARGEYEFWQRRFLRYAQDRFGNTRYATKAIFPDMSITSITTPSNTVMSKRFVIGPIRLSTVSLRKTFIRSIGEA